MAIFEWEDSLSVGIGEIDSQHKELIIKLDELAQCILHKTGKDKIATMLRFMDDYAEMHFATEESYMGKYDYPGLEHQKKEHEKFKNTTSRLIKNLESEKDLEHFASQVQRFLIDWLILHIRTTDLKFGEFLKEK
ncbi:MAG: hemerythrin family protein [Thermoplasmata archaeon]|nr:MAG: hemerythrin family protein [Thermoplasmata archaeon]